MKELLSKSQELVADKKQNNLDLQNRRKEEMAKGTNKKLASSSSKSKSKGFDKEHRSFSRAK